MSKAKVYGLLVIMCATLAHSPKAKAEIKDTSWVNDKMVKIVENTVPMETGVVGESPEKLGYWSMSEKSNHYIVPINVKYSGQLLLKIKADSMQSGKINCGLYKDIRLKERVGSTDGLTKSNLEVTGKYNLKKGTYYIALEKSEKAKGADIKGIIGASILRSDNRTIKKGSVYCGFIEENNESVNYKIKTDTDGYITIATNRSMMTKLKDKDKKDITYIRALNSDNKYSETFALPKGTYYIELKGQRGEFVVGTVFTESVKLDKKVHTIKTGNAERFTVGYDGTTEDKYWVKVELKEPTKLKLTSTLLGGSGQLNFSVLYTGNTKMYFNEYNLSKSKPSSILRLAGDKEWPAGTYYICIQKQHTLSSGVVALKLDQLN